MDDRKKRKVFKLALSERQQEQAKRGYVVLTKQQALHIRGKLTSSSAGGRPMSDYPRCGCGCGLTFARARSRHPKTAVQA